MNQENMSYMMLDLLANDLSIQEIINKATELLTNPIMLSDTRFRVLFASNKIDVDVQLWKETLSRQYISDEMVATFENKEILEKLKQSQTVISTLPNEFHAMRVPLFYKHRYCGFIGMYDYIKPFTKEDEQALVIVSKAITTLLSSEKDVITYDENDYEILLHQLVQCTTSEQAKQVCKRHTPLTFGREKVLITLVKNKSNKKSVHNLPLERLKDTLSINIYHHYSTIYDNRMILVLDKAAMNSILYTSMIASIAGVCRQYHLTAYVSFSFKEDQYIPLAYKQCLFLQHHVIAKEEIIYYENFYLDSVIHQCISMESSSFFIHPYILKVKNYDDIYQTDYYHTFKIYLENFGNLKKTAEILEIHYNTIKYRLSMIEKIIDKEIRNNEHLKIVLYLSMMFFELEKEEGI